MESITTERTSGFIGRVNLFDDIRKGVFVTQLGTGTCYSLMGLNGIGKTRLVEEWAENWRKDTSKDPNIYYFSTRLSDADSEWSYWVKLIQDVRRVIREEQLRKAPNPEENLVNEILDIYKEIDTNPALYSEIAGLRNMQRDRYFRNFFEVFEELGIHLIITIDEFDAAATLFPKEKGDGSFFRKLYSLSGKAGKKNLTILIISRRRIGTLAHGMEHGSDIEDAYPPYALKGFTYQELIEYFQGLDNYSAMTDEAFNAVIGYCGTHPGLLTTMGAAIDSVPSGSPIDVDTLFLQRRLPLEKTFERMQKLMKLEYVDAEKERNCIAPFRQAFLGPVYDSRLASRLKMLQDYGFITHRGEYEENLYELAGWKKEGMETDVFRSYAEQHAYEPVSPYFVLYMKYNVLPEEMDDLDRRKSFTEVNIRKMLVDVYKSKYGPAWRAEMEQEKEGSDKVARIFSGKQTYLKNMDKTAAANRSDMEYTILNVLAFHEYAQIIIKYWDQAKVYFQSYEPEELEKDFFFLSITRNTIEHENAEMLNNEYCEVAAKICERINKGIEEGRGGIVRNKPARPADAPGFSGWGELTAGTPFQNRQGNNSQNTVSGNSAGQNQESQAAQGNTQTEGAVTQVPVSWGYNYEEVLGRMSGSSQAFEITYNFERTCSFSLTDGTTVRYAKGNVVLDGRKYVVAMEMGRHRFEKDTPEMAEVYAVFDYTEEKNGRPVPRKAFMGRLK
ncbi:MAG: ATP-binding protein [Lachnospiraceae bacterium]|nr:ATP-binding protein [Lachnospiraceae bacterium]MBP3609682.1 ATP-binding protein [Lachnospiraceae bacterium]